MPLSAGTRLGPYEILAPIGAGGMGEVYKASDTRLNRIIAIKVLNGAYGERFEQPHESFRLATTGRNLFSSIATCSPKKGLLEVDSDGHPRNKETYLQFELWNCDGPPVY